MPEWLAVFILAVIEGITEFLPISSTGHMLIAEHWLKSNQSDLFLAVVQSGAVLAVLLVFTERLKQIGQQWREREAQQFVFKLGAAFFLTGVGGLILKKLNWELPETVKPVALATLVGGVIILAIEYALKGKQLADSVSWPVALTLGVGQLLAVVFPGLSRSGTTIMIALAMGVGRRPATEFSFLLGVPTLLAAAALEVLSVIKDGKASEYNWTMIFWGTFVAAVTAFVAVKWLLKFVQTHTFVGFGWYRIVLGVVLLLLLAA